MRLTLGLIAFGIAAYAAVQDGIVATPDLRTVTEAASRMWTPRTPRHSADHPISPQSFKGCFFSAKRS